MEKEVFGYFCPITLFIKGWGHISERMGLSSVININIPLDEGGDEEDVPGAGVEGGGAGHQGRGDGILQLWIHHRNDVKQISAL